jgi:hypothetical protein
VERKKSVSSQLNAINATITPKQIKFTTVDFIFKDASDHSEKMPGDAMDVDRMKQKGTYFEGQSFTNEAKFVSFVEANRVHGKNCKSSFYLYTIQRPFAQKLKPSGYHKKNFPTESSMGLICKSRFLVISPNPANKAERQQHFSTLRIDGVTSIDLDSESSGSEKEDDTKFSPYDVNDEDDVDSHLSLTFKTEHADEPALDDEVFVPTPHHLFKSHSYDVGHLSSTSSPPAVFQDSTMKRSFDDVSDDEEPVRSKKSIAHNAATHNINRCQTRMQSGDSNSNSGSSSSSNSKLNLNKNRT